MKESYEKPKMETIIFESEDIFITSLGNGGIED